MFARFNALRMWALVFSVLTTLNLSCAPSASAPSASPVAAVEVPEPPPPVFTYAQLQAEGDRFLAAKYPFQALADYQQASELDPTQAGIWFRLANAAAAAWQGERGTAALDRLAKLKPDSTADADVKALRATIAGLPPRNSRIIPEVVALEKIYFDYKHETSNKRKLALVHDAHQRIAPLICLSGQFDPDAWRFAGYTALAEQNADWGRFVTARLFAYNESLYSTYLTIAELADLRRHLLALPMSRIRLSYRDDPLGGSLGSWQSLYLGSVEELRTKALKSNYPGYTLSQCVFDMLTGKMPFDLKTTIDICDYAGASLSQDVAGELVYKRGLEEVAGGVFCYGLFGAPVDLERARAYYAADQDINTYLLAEKAADIWAAGQINFRGDKLADFSFTSATPLIWQAAVFKDLSTAKKWYLVEAEFSRDRPIDLYNVAQVFAPGDPDKDPALVDVGKFIELNRASADLGFSPAMCDLGDIYWNGRYVVRDLPRAMKWYTKAAAKGEWRAKAICDEQGWRY